MDTKRGLDLLSIERKTVLERIILILILLGWGGFRVFCISLDTRPLWSFGARRCRSPRLKAGLLLLFSLFFVLAFWRTAFVCWVGLDNLTLPYLGLSVYSTARLWFFGWKKKKNLWIRGSFGLLEVLVSFIV